MAKVSPYMDGAAHGKLNNSLIFRRRFGKVALGSMPFPKKTRTPGQIAQRQKFGLASTAFNMLNYPTRSFYKNRSAMIKSETKPLYMHANLSDKLPSQTPGILIKSVDSMLVYSTVGTVPHNILFSIVGEEDGSADVGCFYWSKLNDAPTTLNPEIGPPGSSVSGLTWLPGKFEDGLNLYMTTAYNTYSLGTILTNQLIWDCWYKPAKASTETFPHIQLVYMYGGAWELSMGITRSLDPWAYKKFYIILFDNNNPSQSTRYYFILPSFAADSLHHLEFIVDGNASAGNRMRIIFDYDELSISHLVQDHSFNLSQDWTMVLPQNDSMEGVEDNLKGYGTTQYWEYVRDNQDTEAWSPFPKPGTEITYGSVYDTENVFIPGAPGALGLMLKIEELGGRVTEIPFYYSVWAKWTDYNDNVNDGIMRLPKMTLQPFETKYLYLANDWSLYDNEKLTHLAATNNV